MLMVMGDDDNGDHDNDDDYDDNGDGNSGPEGEYYTGDKEKKEKDHHVNDDWPVAISCDRV